MRDVVVLGAGLTGMTTAFHLGERGLDLVVIDQSDRVGGVIKSVAQDGFLYEEGPNSGVIGNAEVIHLFEALQGECELEMADDFVKRRYVLKNGVWQPLPGGLKAAVTTPLFSLKDKFRILLEPFRPAGKNPHETLAGLVRRRMGDSFLNYAIDPFIIGVYAGDPGRLVPKYALPKLYNLEQEYGSFIGGSIRKQFKSKAEADKKVTRGVFSVKGGISSLIEAMERKIGEEHIILNIGQLGVTPVEDHFVVSFQDKLGKMVTIETKKVISTLGAHQLGQVIPFVESKLLAKISALHYTRVLEIILGFKSWQGMKLDAFGGLIPFVEQRELLGVLFMSSLFRERAPEGGALFSIFMGGVRRQDLVDLSDEEVKLIVQKEFANLMVLNEFQPDLFKIIRHQHAIPQYEADSGERFAAIEKIEQLYPGLIVGGNLRDGIGMADRILQGKRLADSV
jgi:protoporphyrinogen/coproporphyrinogen III oxidase